MQKSPASAPKKLERPFVATSTVWVRDTLQAWEGYAISRHSAKSLHERPMNAMIFVLQGFLSLKLDNKPLNISWLKRNVPQRGQNQEFGMVFPSQENAQ